MSEEFEAADEAENASGDERYADDCQFAPNVRYCDFCAAVEHGAERPFYEIFGRNDDAETFADLSENRTDVVEARVYGAGADVCYFYSF